jgi:catechol 2,3-dioxygenase-like lactoylglutathione lyase family enzyme
MGVAAILHTGLTVSDLDRSVAFYRDLRGLEPIAQWDSSQPYLRAIVAYPDAELRARAGRADARRVPPRRFYAVRRSGRIRRPRRSRHQGAASRHAPRGTSLASSPP